MVNTILHSITNINEILYFIKIISFQNDIRFSLYNRSNNKYITIQMLINIYVSILI